MALFDKSMYEIMQRLSASRMRLLRNYPFYATLLLNLKLSIDSNTETVYTDGVRIAFNIDFINKLFDAELDFILMHETLHVALNHALRKKDRYNKKLYDKACDIVVNSNILQSVNKKVEKITIHGFGEQPHKTPDGKEGYMFSVDEVYRMIEEKGQPSSSANSNQTQQGNNSQNDNNKGTDGEKDEEKNEVKGKGDCKGNRNGKGKGDGKGDGNGEGSGEGSGAGSGKGKGKGNKSSLGGGQNGLSKDIDDTPLDLSEELNGDSTEGSFDDHSFWDDDGDEQMIAKWDQKIVEATEIYIEKSSNSRGNVPLVAMRRVDELKNPKTNWRELLVDFIQEDIVDYSFSPPDRRFEDSTFFLPDFNEKDEKIGDILFAVDASGSMSTPDLTQAYSEVKGALEMFNGKMKGWLGYFDSKIFVKEFSDEEEFKSIPPVGGGGTSFQVIFDYVKESMIEKKPICIIILTDGYAPFPDEKEAGSIPVLWLINNHKVNPPWGKVARFERG